jgi:aspartate/methionine/tyrosine aminotransferase
MRIQPFQMERWQSKWENTVRYNLSESGVHSMTVGDLVDACSLGNVRLGYPQTNGTNALRSTIAQIYESASADNVLVTNGSAEANFVSVWSTIEPNAEMVMMVPNYMQIWGAAQGLGTTVRTFPLKEQGGRWGPDLDALDAAVNAKTKLIALCNPNNPTGSVMTEAEMDRICALADRVGAWVLADEVYRGAERVGSTTSSFWGRYERVFVVSGLSKAYGLPGLRIGWVAGPADRIEELWAYKDYTTICPSLICDRLAQIALEPTMHRRILDRTRNIIRAHYPVVEGWLGSQDGLFQFVPPQAGAIVYARYNLDINSHELIERLRREKSVLAVAGDHFGMSHYVRIGFGHDVHDLEQGLALFGELLAEVAV